jgi:hypothetical protein
MIVEAVWGETLLSPIMVTVGFVQVIAPRDGDVLVASDA